MLIDRQTDRQTDIRHNVLGGSNHFRKSALPQVCNTDTGIQEDNARYCAVLSRTVSDAASAVAADAAAACSVAKAADAAAQTQ